MTGGTQRDQVLLDVVAQLTAKLLVMNLKIAQTAARLTSPAIPLQDFATELLVGLAGKPHPRMFWPDCIHEARCRDKNACFCSPGRNLKNLEMDCKMAIATRTSQVVADLGVGVGHQATSEPLMLVRGVADSSSHCAAGAKPSRLSREVPFTTARLTLTTPRRPTRILSSISSRPSSSVS